MTTLECVVTFRHDPESLNRVYSSSDTLHFLLMGGVM